MSARPTTRWRRQPLSLRARRDRKRLPEVFRPRPQHGAGGKTTRREPRVMQPDTDGVLRRESPLEAETREDRSHPARPCCGMYKLTITELYHRCFVICAKILSKQRKASQVKTVLVASDVILTSRTVMIKICALQKRSRLSRAKNPRAVSG